MLGHHHDDGEQLLPSALDFHGAVIFSGGETESGRVAQLALLLLLKCHSFLICLIVATAGVASNSQFITKV